MTLHNRSFTGISFHSSLDQVVIVAFNKFNLQPLVSLGDEIFECVESVDQVFQLMLLEGPAPTLDGVQKCLGVQNINQSYS